ncbi:MAG TPA: hypothetical protein VIQ52_17090, partial [Arthrobacter sp.]
MAQSLHRIGLGVVSLFFATFMFGSAALAHTLPTAPPTSAEKAPPVKGHWGSNSADIDTWVLDPASGDFSRPEPGAVVSDPNVYKYELQCHLGGGDFDTPCLARQIECKSGPEGKEEGIPVIWLSMPKGVPGAVWSIHSGPTCLYDAKPEDLLPR